LILGYIATDSLPINFKKKKKKRGMIFLTFSKPTPSLTQKKGQIHKKKKKNPAEWGVMIRGENNNKD
jgi:hypothetical protein